jgi:hypothetical protein
LTLKSIITVVSISGDFDTLVSAQANDLFLANSNKFFVKDSIEKEKFMADNLSKAYTKIDEAAMGGFKKIMNNNHLNQFDEYAFFIILTVENHQPTYHYTPPEKIGSSGGALKVTLSKGQILRAYCHTHPRRIQEENFSADDFTEFKRTVQTFSSLVWYLLTPSEQIRVAKSESDFRAGKDVPWISSVQP